MFMLFKHNTLNLGAIIVGSVEGTRIWAKELKARLTHVEVRIKFFYE